MSHMITCKGRELKFSEIDSWEFDIEEIAHHLSHICRWNGALHSFYSVAEHSWILANYFKELDEEELARYALLHDAHEAFVGDMSRGVRLSIDPTGYKRLCSNIQYGIQKQFGLQHSQETTPVAVQNADNSILYNEKEQGIVGGENIDLLSGDRGPRLDIGRITFMSPKRAKSAFLVMFHRLF